MIVDVPEHNNEICVYLSIFGDDFDPEDLTKAIGIKPTHTHRKGDIFRPESPSLRRKEDAWDYNLGYVHTIDSDEISDVIEETFQGKIEVTSQFITEHSLFVKLYVVLNMDPWQTPAVGFKRSFVKMLGDLDAEIEMDIYVRGVPFKELREAGYGGLQHKKKGDN